jgi:TP901 family phage tail tape measure protein
MGEDGRIVYKVVLDDGNVVSEAQAAGKKAGNALKDAKGGAGILQEVMVGAARKIGEAFVDMASQAGGAVKSFVEDSINVGATFERSVDQIAATLGYSAEDIANNVDGAADKMGALEAKAKEMGASTNFTATQAAEGLNILAMSGYDAQHSMEMIEDVLHLAAAGSMDMAQAAGFVSGAMKGFNDETKDSGYYADLMAKGATLANTNVVQLGEALSGSAATAKSYGQSAESVTLSLLRLAEQGETGSNAATMLSAAMKNLFSPTDQAKKALEELGVSVFDEKGKARDFNVVVNELNQALSGFSDAERTAYADTIFGIQGFDAYNKMVVTSTGKQNEWAEALAASSGEAAQQYATMTDNLQGDIDIMNSAMDSLKLSIYESLQPSLRDMTQFGADAFTQMATAMETQGLPGVLSVIEGILGDMVATLIDSAPSMIDSGLTLLEGMITGMAESAPSAMDTAATLMMTILDTILAHLPQLLSAGATLLLSLLLGIMEHLPDVLEMGVKLVTSLISGLIGMLPYLGAAVLELVYGIINIFAGTDWGQLGLDIVNGLWNGITSMWGSFIENVGNLFSGFVGGIMDFLGIASPSKKFKWIMEMVGEGAIEGLDAEEDDLHRTVRRVYEQVPLIAEDALAMDDYEGLSRGRFEQDVSYNLATAGAMGDTTIEVPLYLDGREVARATAWNMGEQLAWEEM